MGFIYEKRADIAKREQGKGLLSFGNCNGAREMRMLLGAGAANSEDEILRGGAFSSDTAPLRQKTAGHGALSLDNESQKVYDAKYDGNLSSKGDCTMTEHLNINPVSHTAMVTLDFLSRTDLPYVQDFAAIFGIEQLHQMMMHRSDFAARFFDYPPRIESRLKGTDRMIRSEGNPNILDLACGFTPRCLYMAQEGYRYAGVDLPFVIEKVQPAVEAFIKSRAELHEYQSKIQYSVADVTDFRALEQATAHLNGSITVTCEGLLGYLPAYEQKEVAKNIHALLRKHGGIWITSDFDEKYSDSVGDMSNFIFQDVTQKQIDTAAVNGMEQACRMFESVGFHVSQRAYHPQFSEITSLSGYTPQDQKLLFQENVQWDFLALQCK